MSCQIFKEVAGVRFKVTVYDCSTDAVKDLSSATALTFVFKKPSGENLEVTASFYTSGTDGILYYDTSATDLDENGTWQLQVFYTISGIVTPTEIVQFKVYPKLRS